MHSTGIFMAWRILCVAQFYGLLCVYTYLGLTPNPGGSIATYNDLLMHFAGYTLAAISISFARPYWHLWKQAIFLLLYSIAIEIAQHYNPPRTFSLSDIVANVGGISVGLGLVALAKQYCPLASRLLKWKSESSIQ